MTGSGGVSEKLRITKAGKVGIATTAPATLLHLGAGESVIRYGATSNGFDIGRNNSSGHFIQNATQASPYNKFLWQQGGAERMRIDSSGRFAIGTASPSANTVTTTATASASVWPLHVLGNDYGTIIKLSASGGGQGVYFVVGSSDTYVGAIVLSGSATSYNTASDYRLKENVQPMSGALEKISALKPVTYDWKDIGTTGQGFIAHELKAVVPECVTGEKDELDAEGKPRYQGVDTSFLVATLTAALQEQQALIEALTTRITALEG